MFTQQKNQAHLRGKDNSDGEQPSPCFPSFLWSGCVRIHRGASAAAGAIGRGKVANTTSEIPAFRANCMRLRVILKGTASSWKITSVSGCGALLVTAFF